MVTVCPRCGAYLPYEDVPMHMSKCLGVDPAGLVVLVFVSELAARTAKIQPGIPLTDELVFDAERLHVRTSTAIVQLTPKEGRLLSYLLVNRGVILTRTQLMGRVWDGADASFDHGLDVYVCRLRNKLKLLGGDDSLIVTIRGVGYRLEKAPHLNNI